MRALYRWHEVDPELDTPGPYDLVLTTEHAASSYGRPVLVVAETGDAVDPFSWTVAWRLTEATDEEKYALEAAGYRVTD